MNPGSTGGNGTVTITTRAKGAGLGLAIARKIIQDHGGTIHAAARADGNPGTEFHVRLPAEA